MNWTDHPIVYQKGANQHYIPEDVYLAMRVCDLPRFRIPRSYQKAIDDVLRELRDLKLSHITLDLYLSDEWFCPDGSTSIAIPFWLMNPTLLKIETKTMGRAEGQTVVEFKKLLRHEIGHCIEHAYKLSRTKAWRNLFGNPKSPYNPDHYQWNPKSKDYVKNLPDGYAQAHPEEDFAETFAVWLNSKSNWRKRYRNWDGALSKLHYVESIAHTLRKKTFKPHEHHYHDASKIRRTLKQIYANRKQATSNI